MFDKFYKLDIRTNWNMQFVQYLSHTIVLGLIISFLGLGLSYFRARRKTDPKKHLFILGFLYLLLFFVYIILR
jgi:hypothetical protein